MTDREKVIKGLEESVAFFRDRLTGEMFNRWLRMSVDAIALLKAQEPRVMTVADIVDNYVAPEVVWVEARNNKGDICLVAGLWNGEYYNMADDSIVYDLGEEIANNPEGYNIRWRCWTSRPTDAQREKVKWDG